MLNTKIKLNKTFFTVVLVLILSNLPAHAENKCISPKNILSVVTADWNDDGHFDRAVLVKSKLESDQTDLFIYLSDSSVNSLELAVYKQEIAWRGALWGTQPSLETNQEGSLIVTSANQAIGRSRWTQKLTITYRSKIFVVANYAYIANDTLVPNYQLDCKIDLLTGKGIKNKKPFQSSVKTVAVINWSDTLIPNECQ